MLLLAAGAAAGLASAQTVEQLQQRLGMGGGGAGRGADTPLVEKPWEQISDQQLFKLGEIAMGRDPKAWRHAETEHFVVHYNRRTDAQKVVRQAEFYYQQVKRDLEAAQDRFDRKNHIFLFEREPEWRRFVSESKVQEWSVGIASRSELFFLSRQHDEFAAGTLAHEITHCIFHRFVPKAIPLWLNEGFAEFESGNAYAKFKGIGGGGRTGGRSGETRYPLKLLVTTKEYPDKEQVHDFYKSSERLVRFFLTKLERNRFVPFVHQMADGVEFEQAVLAIYPERFKSFADFQKAYDRFNQ